MKICADLLQVVGQDEITIVFFHQPCTYCDQFFVRNATEQFESYQQRIRAPFFDVPDHLGGSLHMNDQIFDIRADLIA